MEKMEQMTSPLLAGIPISSRFAEKLGIAQEKQDQQQMTHTKSSTQTVNYEDEQKKALSLTPWPSLENAPTVDLKEKAVDLAMDLNPIGGALNTIRQPLRENFLRRIEREVPELYRETSGSRFLNFFGGNYPFGAPRWNFAETPDMALGQGNNKGLRFKIKTEGLEGKVNRDKPGLEQAYLSGMGEFIVVAQPSDLLKNLKEVVISPEAFTGLSRGEKKRLENTLIQLENKGVPVKRVTTEDFYTLPKEGLNKISSPTQDLEASVQEQVKQLDSTGWNRLPGAAGKRDSDVQNLRDQFKKKYPKLDEPDPSIMEQYEMSLRDKGIPEETIEEVMMPIWSTYGKKIKEKVKKTTEADPLLTAVEKLAGIIEGMNKPKTVIRDKDGRITGVA